MTETPRATTGTGADPGVATRAYLAAIRDRGPLPAQWTAPPTRHKRYPAAPRLSLPWPPERGDAPANAVGELLRHLLGLTRMIWVHPSEAPQPPAQPPMFLLGRPAPSGGGLYPIEAYLATDGVALPAGLYHYDPVHHGLELMRAGDHREPLRRALQARQPPHLVLALTAVFWRSMVKYGEFGYRLICEETGVLLAQAVAVGHRLGLGLTARLLFDDAAVERVLGLDATREAVLAALTVALPGSAPPPPGGPPAGELAAESAPRPAAIPPDDAAARLHLATRTHPARWDRVVVDQAVPPRDGSAQATRLPPGLPSPLADAVPARSSPTCGFLGTPIDLPTLAGILAAAASPYPADLPGSDDGLATTGWYLLALRVDGLTAGAYRYDPAPGAVLPVTAGAALARLWRAPRLLANTRRALPGAAAALIPVGAPLAGVDSYGDRWYRLQQIETGLALQRATLATVSAGHAARIHSDGANETTDAVLGLGAAGWHSLSMLLLGTAQASGRQLACPLPYLCGKEVVPETDGSTA